MWLWMAGGRRQSIRQSLYSEKTRSRGKTSIAPTAFRCAFTDLVWPTVKLSFYLVPALTNCLSYITQKAGPMSCSESQMLLVAAERRAGLWLNSLLNPSRKEKGKRTKEAVVCGAAFLASLLFLSVLIGQGTWVYRKWRSGGTSDKFFSSSPTFPQVTATDVPQILSPLFRIHLPVLSSHYVLFHQKLSSNFLHSSDHRLENVHHHQHDLQKAPVLCILNTGAGLLVSTFMTGSKWSNEVETK